MLVDVFDFLASKARGLILTITGTGAAWLPETVDTNVYAFTENLHPLQTVVLLLTGVVALLTIISYFYKFYLFCKNRKKSK